MSFLLFSASFPRSSALLYSTVELSPPYCSGSPIGSYTNEAERITGGTLAQLNFQAL